MEMVCINGLIQKVHVDEQNKELQDLALNHI